MSTISSEYADPWLQYLPDLHRALAAPEMANGLPQSFISLDHSKSCAWWETLRYLFRTQLGWRCLPAGLAWWYEAGQPTFDDPRLEMVMKRWNARRELDYFAAREWASGGNTGGPDEGPEWSIRNYEPSVGWLRELQIRPHLMDHNPYAGGANPLHLCHSDSLAEQRPTGPSTGFYDLATRKATLVVSGFDSWQQELRAYGTGLPSLSDRSWMIEVFDRKVGFLGRFRQSRVTGLWFQGKHGLHIAGNPQTNATQ
jgi:hypothetical protein